MNTYHQNPGDGWGGLVFICGHAGSVRAAFLGVKRRGRHRLAVRSQHEIEPTRLSCAFSELAFRLAAASAVRGGLQKAKSVLLEPVMRVELDTPGEVQGELLGDLARRRGNVLAVEPGQSNVLVKSQVPLAELWGYANAIRSLSRGRASYSMSPSHFERVPNDLAMKIATASGSD